MAWYFSKSLPWGTAKVWRQKKKADLRWHQEGQGISRDKKITQECFLEDIGRCYCLEGSQAGYP